MRQLSANMLAAAHAAETDQIFVVLLKISHSAISTLYLCDNLEPVVTTGAHPAGAHTWTPFPLVVQMPDQTPDQLPVAKLTIDTIGMSQQIVVGIRTAPVSEPLLVEFFLIRTASPDAPEIILPPLHWRGIEYSADMATGDLLLPENFADEPFPSGTFNPNNFPGVF